MRSKNSVVLHYCIPVLGGLIFGLFKLGISALLLVIPSPGKFGQINRIRFSSKNDASFLKSECEPEI